jgi:hypothetical protein
MLKLKASYYWNLTLLGEYELAWFDDGQMQFGGATSANYEVRAWAIGYAF